jgi:hypothetical protein
VDALLRSTSTTAQLETLKGVGSQGFYGFNKIIDDFGRFVIFVDGDFKLGYSLIFQR